MRLILICIAIGVTYCASAQTWDEWFNQQETQKKYLLQQIAALKVYIDYTEKGYNIANQGLQTIHSIKSGDFEAHNTFFNSLKQVNPAIANWSRVADIIAVQIQIVKKTKQAIDAVKQQNQFTSQEVDYCKNVFDLLLADCLKEIDDLVAVTTSGQIEMKDDERIKRVEAIFLDMQDKYSFANSFGDEMKTLSLQRLGEQKETEFSQMLDK